MRNPLPTSKMRLAAALLPLVSAAGCTMMMTPKAQQVTTQIAPATKSCNPRGIVFALAPFSSPEQPLDQLKMRASQIGANTIVLLGQGGTKDWSARAYRCGTVHSDSNPTRLPSLKVLANSSSAGPEQHR